MKKFKSYISIVLAALFLISCNPNPKKDQVSIAMVEWSECVALTQLAKVALEQNGYNVNIVIEDVAPAYDAVATGKADLFLDVWEPFSHEPYIMKYENQLELIGTINDNARLGFAVPNYVTIDSVSELNEHIDRFNHQIIGINPGAGIMNVADNVIRDYQLNYSLISSSESKMLESLKNAIANHEWIIVTGWEPHPMNEDFGLKFLEEPKGIFGRDESISIMATKGWAESNPDLDRFLGNFRLDNKKFNSLMKEIVNSPGNEYQAAKKWYSDNKALVDAWFE